jgi:hypothetical protein
MKNDSSVFTDDRRPVQFLNRRAVDSLHEVLTRKRYGLSLFDLSLVKTASHRVKCMYMDLQLLVQEGRLHELAILNECLATQENSC